MPTAANRPKALAEAPTKGKSFGSTKICIRAPKIPERKNSNKNFLGPIRPSTILPKLAINIKLKVM